MNDTKLPENLDQSLATRKSDSECSAAKPFETELPPVASEEFMTTVEDLPVQERDCWAEREKPHDRR